ncbi:11572_t:CDS:2, partial [Scutellospora calospora]
VTEPPTLEQAIEEKEYLESDIDELNKRMQLMTANYEKLITALAVQVETNAPRPCPAYNNNNSGPQFTCYNCGKAGHMAREYEGYTPEAEEEVFITPEVRYQPFPLQRTQSHIKKSESQTEERLRNNSPATEFPPGTSEIDKLEPYNVVYDLLSMKANITIGQVLKYPNQRRNLALALKRPFLPEEMPTPPPEMMETNTAQTKESGKTTAARCYVRIKNNLIIAVLNSGAAVSIMSIKTMDKLKLQINEPSTTIIVTTNGTRVRALGRIKDVKLALGSMMVSTTFHIIESTDDMLLL